MRTWLVRISTFVLSISLLVTSFVADANASQLGADRHSVPRSIYCEPGIYLVTSNRESHYMIPLSSQVYKDGPGGSMSLSVTRSGTVAATATVSVGVTVSDIISSAKVDVSASITKSVGITTGHVYSHVISAHKCGNAEYGSWGYYIAWNRIQMFSNCAENYLARGTGKMPTNSVGWNYWETSS